MAILSLEFVRTDKVGKFLRALYCQIIDSKTEARRNFYLIWLLSYLEPKCFALGQFLAQLSFLSQFSIFRYAIATNENMPGVRHLFKIGDTNSSQPWTCLTCQPKLDFNTTFYDPDINETILNSTMLADYKCEYNNVIFSHSYR